MSTVNGFVVISTAIAPKPVVSKPAVPTKTFQVEEPPVVQDKSAEVAELSVTTKSIGFGHVTNSIVKSKSGILSGDGQVSIIMK